MKVCSTSGCTLPYSCKGFCRRCYEATPARRAQARAKDAERYKRDPSRKARNQAWAEANKAKAYAKQQEWRLQNLERCRELSRQSYARCGKKQVLTPEQQAVKNQARKARLLGVPGKHTKHDRLALFEAYGWRCTRCAADLLALPSKQRTLDHIIPLSKPGSSNGIENLLPMCGSCNSSKCNRC